MSCNLFSLDDIHRYLDDDMSNDEKERINEHLESCEICLDNMRTIKVTIDTINGAGRETAPETLWPRIYKNINKSKQAGRVWRYLIIPSVTMAVFIFVFIAGEKRLKIKDSDINNYIGVRMNYLSDDSFIDTWYLNERQTSSLTGNEYVFDLFFNEENTEEQKEENNEG